MKRNAITLLALACVTCCSNVATADTPGFGNFELSGGSALLNRPNQEERVLSRDEVLDYGDKLNLNTDSSGTLDMNGSGKLVLNPLTRVEIGTSPEYASHLIDRDAKAISLIEGELTGLEPCRKTWILSSIANIQCTGGKFSASLRNVGSSGRQVMEITCLEGELTVVAQIDSFDSEGVQSFVRRFIRPELPNSAHRLAKGRTLQIEVAPSDEVPRLPITRVFMPFEDVVIVSPEGPI